MGETRKCSQEKSRQDHLGLINYKKQTGLIICIALPRDENIQDKELEKIDEYQSLKIELEQLWKVKLMVVSVVV